MIRSLVFSFLIFASIGAQADLASEFMTMNGLPKGPFGDNMLQSPTERTSIRDGLFPADPVLFQAAYRNDYARNIATNYDVYFGNLFTTNYYELMGEFVYGDAYGTHALDEQALVAQGAAALPKASSMVRSWVLEKYYVLALPTKKLARCFVIRGISDVANEQTFASYFLNFYLSAMTEDFQFLPAYMLAKGSPIAASATLEKARIDIANLYTTVSTAQPELEKAAVSLALYKLRNAIHNQLSIQVIGQIDAFTQMYPGIGTDVLASIRANLVAYYNVSAQKVAALASKAGASAVAAAANAIVKVGSNPATLLTLSNAVAALRTNIRSVPYTQKTNSLVVLLSGSQFLNKEINSMKSITSKDVITTLINLVYIEGFLIQDNWQYFAGQVATAATAKEAAEMFPDISEIAVETLQQAFSPSLDQWKSIEPQMANFIDNSIKSSALNTASTIVTKIR